MRVDYRAYLQSPQWAARRKMEYARAKSKCQACGNKAENIHHRTYARLGQEADGDLVALCRLCHEMAHAYHAKCPAIGLWDATNILIRQNRALFGLPPVTLPKAKTVAKAAKAARDAEADRRLRQKVRRAQKRARRERLDQLNPARVERRREQSRLANSATKAEIRQVACPKCDAPQGEPCVTTIRTNGRANDRPRNHMARVKRYNTEKEARRNAAA